MNQIQKYNKEKIVIFIQLEIKKEKNYSFDCSLQNKFFSWTQKSNPIRAFLSGLFFSYFPSLWIQKENTKSECASFIALYSLYYCTVLFILIHINIRNKIPKLS